MFFYPKPIKTSDLNKPQLNFYKLILFKLINSNKEKLNFLSTNTMLFENSNLKCSKTIVFKPGQVASSVQDSGSGFWPGHQVGRVNPYFKKIQNGIVFVKKSTGCIPVFNRVFPSQSDYRVNLQGHIRSSLFLFFFQPGPVPAPDQPAGPARFQNCE